MDVEKLVDRIMFRKKFKKFVKTYSDLMLEAVYPSQYDPFSDYEVVDIDGQLWKHFVVETDGGSWWCDDELRDMKMRLRRHFDLNDAKCDIR